MDSAEQHSASILESITDGLVTLDQEWRFTYVNAEAERVLGRTRADLIGKCVWEEYPHNLGTEVERELRRVAAERVSGAYRGHDPARDRWYDNRVYPMPDGGVVIYFRDVTERRRSEQRTATARAFAESIVTTVREPLLVLDKDLYIVSANRSFYATFRVELTETEGRFVYDIGNGQWNIPALRTLLEGIVPANAWFDDFKVDHTFEHIGPKTMLLNARRFPPEGPFELLLLAIEDITERQQADEALRQALAGLERRIEERTSSLARANQDVRTEANQRRRAEEARTELLRRLATAQEDERRRLSRELHDQVGQQLASLILGLKALREGDQVAAPGQGLLEKLQKIAEELGRELHDVALRLRPTALDDLGVHAALQSAVEEWSRRCGVEADFHSAGLEGRRLSGEVETVLYRVVMEALHNVLKHARATHVSVLLEHRNHHAVAIVEDDGVGFDTESALSGEPTGRLGLLGMRERVALLGGTLEVESTPGAGTTVFARIPLPPEEESQP